ncbi:CvpA family protein [Pseudaestuariivita rosea]|uniref:CvpA family protein n=1 Tax=Pseudaestuariivita rosea TaxID=2763263 RepID=UPI001ABB01F6|nr:CvpA family protein [Pseudaestuariivita rosea]
MEGFNIVDGGVVVLVIVSAILAYSRGFVREAMAIVGWIGAAVAAFLLTPQVEPLVKEVPVVGDFVGDSCEIAIIVAAAAVFAAALVVFSLFTPLLSGMIQRSSLSGIDRGLGFLFGVIRGLLLVAIAFFVYDIALGGSVDADGNPSGYAMINDSRSSEVFASLTGQIEDRDPEQALSWLRQQYQTLQGDCGPAAPESPAAEPAPAPESPAIIIE